MQDEFNVLNFHSVLEAYQETLRIEEKLSRRQQNVRSTSGYGRGKHKEKQVEETESSSAAVKETTGKGFDVDRGHRWMERVRGRGVKFTIIS